MEYKSKPVCHSQNLFHLKNLLVKGWREAERVKTLEYPFPKIKSTMLIQWSPGGIQAATASLCTAAFQHHISNFMPVNLPAAANK